MNQSVIEKCQQLNLKALVDNFEETLKVSKSKNWSMSESLSHLLNLELERRANSRIELRYKQSKLYEKLTKNQFDFDHHKSRSKSKRLILDLMDAGFVENKKDIILIGHPGTGKTFLAKTIGYQATLKGIKTLFCTAMDMINHLIAAEADHSLLKKLSYYQSFDLLIIDEIGYLPLDEQGTNFFFQVIGTRHQSKSTMITTNLSFVDWGKIFGSITAATAIADRLVHNSEILILEGASYRKKNRK